MDFVLHVQLFSGTFYYKWKNGGGQKSATHEIKRVGMLGKMEITN